MKKTVFFGLLLTSALAFANANVQTKKSNHAIIENEYDKAQATCTITFTIRNEIGMIVAQWKETYEVSAFDFAGCERIARSRAAEMTQDTSPY